MTRPLPPAEALNLVPLADIARGGMGSVQLCRVQGGRLDGRALAVKRLNPELERDPQFVDMFIDETWMTAAIKSPNVIHVEAWGKDPQGHYLAVELVQGVSLSRLVKESRAQKEPFSERTVACILSQICGGLEAAHGLRDATGASLNMVHRDLTPGNILVAFDGLVKIADFGIAKANARLTQTTAGTMKGKPSYMAPEQARGFPVDARADLFSLGVMAYELLAGTRPWIGSTDFEILIGVSSKEPADLSTHRQVDPVFLEITRGCLQKDRDKRFASATEIREKLDTWRRARGFEADDLGMLSAFVTRNTPKQLDWFKRALAGGQRDGATFKDVEEQIDRARRPSPSTDPKRSPLTQGRGIPAGTMPLMPNPNQAPTRQAPQAHQGSIPKGTAPLALPPRAGPPNIPPPQAPPPRPPGPPTGTALHVAPAPAAGMAPYAAPHAQPDVDDLAQTRMVVDDLASTRMADDLLATRVAPPSTRVPITNLGGTVALTPEEIARARSGLGSGPSSSGRPAPAPPPPSSPVAHLADLSPPPPRAQPYAGSQAQSWQPPSHMQGFPQGPPVSVGVPQSGPRSGGPQSPRPSSSGRGQQFVFHGEALPPLPKPRKGKAVVVVIVVMMLVLGAAAVAAYFLRARLGLLR